MVQVVFVSSSSFCWTFLCHWFGRAKKNGMSVNYVGFLIPAIRKLLFRK